MIAQDVAGRYDLEYELGSDAISTVYQALDRHERLLVSLRLFSAEASARDNSARTLTGWAERHAALQHPNIARIIGWGVDDERVYVVSELAPGGSLRSVLSSSERLNVDRAVAISAEVLDALQAAHERGFTHGDLRPEQILFSARGEVKVSDFGLRSAVREAGLDGDAGPAGGDAPPEPEAEEASAPNDVRQAAGVLYEMLVGRPPIRATSRRTNLVTSPRLVNSSVPAWLDRVVARALHADPAQRYLHAAALRVALEVPTPAAQARKHAPVHTGPSKLVAVFGGLVRSLSQVLFLLLPAVAAGIVVALVATTFLIGRVVFSGPVTDLAVVETPSFVGSTFEEATARASELGMNVARNSERPTEDQPRDTILSQWPAPGTSLRRGSTIRLAVSSGLRAPNVIGQPLDVARRELEGKGWQVGPVENNPTFWIEPNKVVQQTPGAGEIVADRTALRLSIAVLPPNIALDQPTRASAGTNPQGVVDDKLDTTWSAESTAPAWIEVSLGGPRAVQRVELVVSMKPEGWAGHEIWLIDSKGQEQKVWVFGGEYKDGQVLTKQFTPAMTNITAVRIVTSGSVAVPAWKEIRVY